MCIRDRDKDKNPITDASITVEKDGWDKVTPASDGSYKMENGEMCIRDSLSDEW